MLALFTVLSLVLAVGLVPSQTVAGRTTAVEAGGQTGTPENMVLVSAGDFLMGDLSEGDHSPVHSVHVDAFWLDKCEVTNAQYYAFCKESQRKLPEFWGKDDYHSGTGFPNHPVVGVSWQDACDYAAWRGKRLPSEAEWEYAARGGLVGRKFPNGDEISIGVANYSSKDGLKGAAAVGSFPANGFGLYDMAGNVGEWTADLYSPDYYASSPRENPKGPSKGKFRVIRGGGWHSGPYCNRVYVRNALPANWVDFNVGFRCVQDLRK
jgi:iron(II)-dependent oxidoreductase